jgi:hypothetical protein
MLTRTAQAAAMAAGGAIIAQAAQAQAPVEKRNPLNPAPVDLRVQYRWDSNITLFAAIDNVQNIPTDTTLRRAYRAGVRFSY